MSCSSSRIKKIERSSALLLWKNSDFYCVRYFSYCFYTISHIVFTLLSCSSSSRIIKNWTMLVHYAYMTQVLFLLCIFWCRYRKGSVCAACKILCGEWCCSPWKSWWSQAFWRAWCKVPGSDKPYFVFHLPCQPLCSSWCTRSQIPAQRFVNRTDV